ncbi:MAG: hypothetical protein VCA36_09835, partial [Opitutales bacterium]
ALERTGSSGQVFAVSRFSDAHARESLQSHGIETIAVDVLDREAVGQLPHAANVVFMLGMKFGMTENPSLAWAMNTQAPAAVAERFVDSRMVAFSSGNVYPYLATDSAGATEDTATTPVGEYGWSLLGRERTFEHFSLTHGTKVALVRLNYAVEARYGILVDLAQCILAEDPVDLTAGHVNLIWQRDANEHALRCMRLASSPPTILNVTGHEVLAVRDLAVRLGEALGVEPKFTGQEAGTALLSDASRSHDLFGRPSTSINAAIGAVTAWLKDGLPTLGKPTKFEARDGRF